LFDPSGTVDRVRSSIQVLALSFVLAACSVGGQVPVTTIDGGTAVTTTTTRPPPTTAPPGSTEPTPATTTTTLAPLTGLRYEPVARGLPFPTNLIPVPGEQRALLATKDGRVWELAGDGLVEMPLLDLRDRVRDSGEQGLLGLAVHPDDPGRWFVHYSALDGDTVLSEFREDTGAFDSSLERVLLRLDQPASNHNGGQLSFGPDGMLYLGLGDGGGADDRFGQGQRPDTLLATIVRIDPDGGDPYGIPADNPFADGEGGAPEVWAFGLRNPWRFWFDGPWLYIGDVGQNAFEEIDVVSAEPAGYNFGWPITEGFHCFSPSSGCEVEGLTLPALEISHGDAGTCSVTGGVVYRGAAIPELEGHYLYSDFCGGYLRSFRWDGAAAVEPRDWTDQVGVPGQVVSFGVDPSGEVYVLTTDAVYRIEPVR
jgi:glucose/arabinose dehydrogenase